MTSHERAELIASFVRSFAGLGGRRDSKDFKQSCSRTAAFLKNFKGVRTNPFAIQDRLNGLEEKAVILRRDDLGAAIRSARARADGIRTNFMPEFLELLLELSDRPLEKVDLKGLSRLPQKETQLEPTWAEIIQDDPLDNSDGLWDDVNFGEESSIDDEDISFISGHSDGSPASASIDEGSEFELSYHDFKIHAESNEAIKLGTSRSIWSSIKKSEVGSQSTLSELQIIREVVFMLRGYETDLFSIKDNKFIPFANVSVRHLSDELLYGVLGQFSSLGSHLFSLRLRTREDSSLHLMQSFQSAFASEIHSFDLSLSEIELRCIEPVQEPPTLLEVLSDVRLSCRKLLALGEVYKNKDTSRRGFEVLETLYELASLQQSAGNVELYTSTLNIFERCFHTYLRPINAWILCGDVDMDQLPLVKRNKSHQPLESLWEAHFQLIFDSNKRPNAPYFLEPFINTILNTGKSLNFSKALGNEYLIASPTPFRLNRLIDNIHSRRDLTPFSQVFQESFSAWIQPIHLQTTATLNETLRLHCGLQGTVAALNKVFLGQESSCLDFVADAFLDRLGTSPSSLRDASLLSSIYHEAFAGSFLVEEERITVNLKDERSVQGGKAVLISTLESMIVSYKIPWAVGNIIRSETIRVYRRAHSLLLHVRIAKRAIDEKFHQKMIRHGQGSGRPNSLALRLSHQLRWFTHTIQTYLLGIVVQEAIPTFIGKLDEPGDVDAKIQAHSDFIKKIERRFLFRTQAIRAYHPILSMLDLALVVATYLRSQWQLLYSTTAPAVGAVVEAETKTLDEERMERLNGFASTYTKFLGFAYAGVQEVARVEGDKCLQMLAENLATGHVPSAGRA